jgi:hypothetical protein
MFSEPSERRWSLLSSVPIITLGLLLVTIAMLKAPWPSDPESLTGTTVSYGERLQGKQASGFIVVDEAAKSPEWYGRRIFDGLALGLLLIGYVGVTLMIGLNEWRALIILTLVGIGGTLYGGSVGLYAGPILTTGGFALVLFGAGLSLISQTIIETKYHELTQTEREKYDTHFAAQP